MSIRETAGQFSLTELKASTATVYQSREEYRQITGKEAPIYNPDLPNKYWAWTAPATGKIVSFFVASVVSGEPAIVEMSLPLSYAQTVNIPRGGANAEPAYSNDWMDFPIDPPRPDEYLALIFGGIIVVRNRLRFVEDVPAFEHKVMRLLERIATKLGA